MQGAGMAGRPQRSKASRIRGLVLRLTAAVFMVDLPDLGGAAKLRALDVPVRTLMSFEGH